MTIKTKEIMICDTCGKEIDHGDLDSRYTAFSRPDLDYFHGIWMGDVGEFYTGARTQEEKHFCDIHCLIGDILKFYRNAKYQKEHGTSGDIEVHVEKSKCCTKKGGGKQ